MVSQIFVLGLLALQALAAPTGKRDTNLESRSYYKPDESLGATAYNPPESRSTSDWNPDESLGATAYNPPEERDVFTPDESLGAGAYVCPDNYPSNGPHPTEKREC